LSSSSEHRRIGDGGTGAFTAVVGFSGVIDGTVVVACHSRVCPGFTLKFFDTSAGSRLPRRSRIAFPHIDARERFNRREICAADAVGQQPTSMEISCAVQSIIGNLVRRWWCSGEIRAGLGAEAVLTKAFSHRRGAYYGN
jgi:hypothetical protein